MELAAGNRVEVKYFSRTAWRTSSEMDDARLLRADAERSPKLIVEVKLSSSHGEQNT